MVGSKMEQIYFQGRLGLGKWGLDSGLALLRSARLGSAKLSSALQTFFPPYLFDEYKLASFTVNFKVIVSQSVTIRP